MRYNQYRYGNINAFWSKNKYKKRLSKMKVKIRDCQDTQ